MQAGKFAEQILRLYYGGDLTDENGLQFEDIMLLVSEGANTYIHADYFARIKEEGRLINGLFISTFEDVPVQYSSSRNKYYIVLPATPIQLFHGVDLEILPMQGDDSIFIPLPIGFISRTYGTPISELEGQTGYIREGKKAFFHNWDTAKQAYMKTVLVRQIADVLDLGEEDELPIPGNYLGNILDFVKSKLPPRGTPIDTINDNKAQ